MKLLKRGAVAVLRVCATDARFSRIADYGHNRLVYERLRAAFISNGSSSKYGVGERRDLVRQFELVDDNVPRETSRTDFLYIAESLLSLECQGDIVECGCYAGASTCKLSLLAAATSRRLRVFDSFCGLPPTEGARGSDFHTRYPTKSFAGVWKQGLYGTGLDSVRAAVQNYGDIGVCSFCEGWFDQTLVDENLFDKIALAFVDVDLPDSVSMCLRGVWPRIGQGGAFFSHDVAFIKATLELLSPRIWEETFRESPPVLFGAGYGMGDHSPHLGVMVKSRDAAYLKSLTLEK